MISTRDIEKHHIKWAMADDFTDLLNYNKPFILNTDVSIGGGIHWITMVPMEQHVYIIDSLGHNNPRNNNQLIIETIKNEGKIPIFYKGSFQYTDDSLCGWHALYMTRLIKNYKGELTPKVVDHIVNKAVGRTADEGDVHQLIKAFGIKK